MKHSMYHRVAGIALAGLLVAATPQLSSSQAAVKATSDLTAAKSYFNEGEFDKAISKLTAIVQHSSGNEAETIESREWLAVAYAYNNQDDEARATFSDILRNNRSYKPSSQWWSFRRLIREYFKSRQELGLPIGLEPAASGIKTVAIMEFDNYSIDDVEKYANLGKAFSQFLITGFGSASNLRIVERERLQFIMDELNLQNSKYVDPATAVRLGKLSGAQSFVFGSFIKMGKKVTFTARIVKTETGEVFKTAEVTGKPENVTKLAQQLATRIARDLESAIRKAGMRGKKKFKRNAVPLQAFALYGDAIADADRERFKGARAKLERAIRIAPDFRQAREMLSVIRPKTY